MANRFHVPTRPFTPIDALNRRAAAVGSPGYAQATAYADYNGHHISVTWNDYRGYYIAEYFWAGRVVLARGTFENCLRAALDEYKRGALGCSVSVSPRADDAEAQAICDAEPLLIEGALPQELPWYTWQHRCAAGSVRDYAHPGSIVLRFDLALMQASDSEAEYLSALKSTYGSHFAL